MEGGHAHRSGLRLRGGGGCDCVGFDDSSNCQDRYFQKQNTLEVSRHTERSSSFCDKTWVIAVDVQKIVVMREEGRRRSSGFNSQMVGDAFLRVRVLMYLPLHVMAFTNRFESETLESGSFSIVQKFFTFCAIISSSHHTRRWN